MARSLVSGVPEDPQRCKEGHMKTAITVVTGDRIRFLLGMKITGDPMKATREHVSAYFQAVCDTEIARLEKEADELVASVVAKLDQGVLESELMEPEE
jgi:hypothetical protein